MATALERYLKEMEDPGKPLASSKLANLSGLSQAELSLFQKTWPQLPPERRRQLCELLAELAQDNLELDFDDVFRTCLEDPDAEVRLQALEGLEGTENRSFISPLLAHLQRDSEERVRARAASSLGYFLLQAELGHLPERESRPVERALLAIAREGKEPLEVRRRAVEALGPLSKEPVHQVIREAYASADAPMRASALYAMGRNCDPGWLPLLIKESKNAAPELRYEAARAMGEIEDPAATPSLTSLLQDPNREVQLAAIEALGHIPGPPARHALQQLLSHPDPALQEAVTAALAEQSFWEEPLSFG